MVVVEFFRCPVGERRVGPDTIVIVSPRRQQRSRFVERGEQRLVQQLVAQPPVETLDERVLLRFAGLDVVPVDAAGLAPFEDRHAGQLGAVVGDACHRSGSPPRDHGVQLARDAGSRERRVGDQRQAFPRGVRDVHAAELRLPLVEGAAADPVLAADVRRRTPRFLLPQDADDLLFRKSALTHRPSPSGGYGLYPNLEESEGLRSTSKHLALGLGFSAALRTWPAYDDSFIEVPTGLA